MSDFLWFLADAQWLEVGLSPHPGTQFWDGNSYGFGYDYGCGYDNGYGYGNGNGNGGGRYV